MIKVLTVVGARPQFVKAAVVSRALAANPSVIEVLVHTGQHYDENMSGIFFDELGMARPDYNFGISGGGHGQMTGSMLAAVESAIAKEVPDWVLVYGDTNSTLAASLAAAKMNIRVAHVEAGLRSFNRRMPEEINRIVSDHVSSLLFSPTPSATDNLIREGIDREKIVEVGDVMYDAALHYGAQARTKSLVLDEVGVASGRYILATVHRQENTDDVGRLESICRALSDVSRDIPVVFLVHPRTADRIKNFNLEKILTGVKTHCPVGYLDMSQLQKNAAAIATDSGGVQKEAYFYRVPCVTLRDETEWVELVECGWNVLAPPLSEGIAACILEARYRPGKDVSLYGEGQAANRIADVLLATN